MDGENESSGITDLFYVIGMGDVFTSLFGKGFAAVPAAILGHLLNFGINGLIWAAYIVAVAWAVNKYAV